MTEPHFDTLLYRRDGAITQICFNRPHRLNAVTDALYEELNQALDHAQSDHQTRVIVLTGAGRAFCVGADLKAHAAGTRTAYERRQYLNGEQRVCKRLMTLSKPVIAAVNGYALGAGAELAVACDFMLMARSAQWGLPEVGLGTFIGGGLTQLLPQLVGLGRARELIYFGTRLSGPQAVEAGLAQRCFDDESFHQNVHEFALKLSQQAPISMALAKEHLLQGLQRHLDDTLRSELEAMMFCTTTRDWQEGIDAWAEKRKPDYTGA